MGWEKLTDPVNRAVSASLGVPATWTPKGSGSPVAIRAVFRRNRQEFDAESGCVVETTSSAAMIRADDLPRAPEEEDGFTIQGLEFLVAGTRPDGQGGILLILERKPST